MPRRLDTLTVQCALCYPCIKIEMCIREKISPFSLKLHIFMKRENERKIGSGQKSITTI